MSAEVKLIQHVLPDGDLHGMYNGRETRYVYNVSRMRPESWYMDTHEICRIQSIALLVLAKDPEALANALSDLPEDYVRTILEKDFDPEQFAVHAIAQIYESEPVSPAIVQGFVSSENDLLSTIEEVLKRTRGK